MKGGVAAKEGKLKVGDVVTSVDGISVKGKKVLSVMSESATSFSLVVSRYTSAEQQALHAGDAPADVVDIEGWLFKVKARDGRAIRLPKKRWVVLQGSTLTWFEDAKGEAEANSQALLGAVCTIPMKSSNYAMTPAMKAFAELHKFPFMLHWPNGEVNHEMVFAASTSGDRAQWANLLMDAINRAKSGAPTAGWMYKEGGRKSGISLAGWKKRWFVLTPPSKTAAGELKYYEGPNSKKPKGVIGLKGSDVFIPKRLRGNASSSHRHCFCVTSQGGTIEANPMLGTTEQTVVTTCTLLACSSADELEKWMASLNEAIAMGNAAAAGKGGGAAPSAEPKKKAMGGDAGAANVQSGGSSQTANLEQMKNLDEETLLTLRIKQLKGVLEHMSVDYSDCVEKKDLVSKIIKRPSLFLRQPSSQ